MEKTASESFCQSLGAAQAVGLSIAVNALIWSPVSAKLVPSGSDAGLN
jgi:hypothetical protein